MTERARYWSDLVSAWGQSGLSQVEFCRMRGIKAGTFAWWKRQFGKPAGDLAKRRGQQPRPPAARFVEVRLPAASPLPTYEVVLARGRSVRVPAEFDPQVLSRLITAVESC